MQHSNTYRGKWDGLPASARMRDLVYVAWSVAGRQAVRAGLTFYIDCSQCVSREPWSTTLGAFTTHSIVFDLKRECVLLEEERWALHGLPMEAFPLAQQCGGVTRMVREGMVAPCIATLLAGMYYNTRAPWWTPRGV